MVYNEQVRLQEEADDGQVGITTRRGKRESAAAKKTGKKEKKVVKPLPELQYGPVFSKFGMDKVMGFIQKAHEKKIV